MWNLRFQNCTFRNNAKYGLAVTGGEDILLDRCAIAAGPDTKEGYLLSAAACDCTISNSTFDGTAFPGSQVRQLKTEYVPPGCHNRLWLCGNRFKSVNASIQSDTTTVFSGNTFENARLWAYSGHAVFLGGGVPDVFLDAREHGKIVFCGESFNYDAAGGSLNGGQITGVWYDNTPLAVNLWDFRTDKTWSHVVLHKVPARLAVTGPAEVTEGRSARYTCTAWFPDNTSQDVSCGARWSVDGDAAAMIAGRFTADRVKGEHICRVTAALAGQEASLKVTIRGVKPMD
jgi:hypothetical protein